MVNKSSIKQSNSCEIINFWGNSIKLRKVLMKEDELYLDELFLLSFISALSKRKKVRYNDLDEGFNIFNYKRAKMIENLTKRGYLKDDLEGRLHNYVITISGEQLLTKYKKLMERLCDEL